MDDPEQDQTGDRTTVARTGVLRRRHGAYLPHWTLDGAIFAVTFRLVDSLPVAVMDRLVRERDERLARVAALPPERQRLARVRAVQAHAMKVERLLDRGVGRCLMRDPRVAALVRDALLHFDGARYTLSAWAIMPNHVHAVMQPHGGIDLPSIMHSWKGFTAQRINRLIGGRGTLWQREYYDRIIRDEREYYRTLAYVLDNPRRAGLSEWPWVGPSV